jgi:hypothetical protein
VEKLRKALEKKDRDFQGRESKKPPIWQRKFFPLAGFRLARNSGTIVKTQA